MTAPAKLKELRGTHHGCDDLPGKASLLTKVKRS